MIRASGLYGRALVDLDTADRIGYVDEIIVDPYGPCIAGFVVARGRSVLGSRKHTIIPAEAIYAIGPDALTMRGAGRAVEEAVYLNSLPRLSELTGRKMISFGGKFLGTVEDALIDERDGRIVGYPLDGGPLASGLERLFSLGLRPERSAYVRANADLRVGARLIVVPDDAVASMEDDETPALPERTADSPTPTPTALESERKTPVTRHRRMAVPFAEHDAALAAARTSEPVSEHAPEREAQPSFGVDEALDEELVPTSQIPADAIHGRRARSDREEVAD